MFLDRRTRDPLGSPMEVWPSGKAPVSQERGEAFSLQGFDSPCFQPALQGHSQAKMPEERTGSSVGSEHQTSNLGVGGSSPPRPAILRLCLHTSEKRRRNHDHRHDPRSSRDFFDMGNRHVFHLVEMVHTGLQLVGRLRSLPAPLCLPGKDSRRTAEPVPSGMTPEPH